MNIDTYRDGVNCTWDESFARQALRWERRLELAMENGRFFDLVRWGIAEQAMNQYYNAERMRRPYYSSASLMRINMNTYPSPRHKSG
jgi:hypothetical protein